MKTLAEGLANFRGGFATEVEIDSSTAKGIAIHIWKPIVVEDLDIRPIKIESKQQYKRELKARGLECRGLM